MDKAISKLIQMFGDSMMAKYRRVDRGILVRVGKLHGTRQFLVYGDATSWELAVQQAEGRVGRGADPLRIEVVE